MSKEGRKKESVALGVNLRLICGKKRKGSLTTEGAEKFTKLHKEKVMLVLAVKERPFFMIF